MAPFSSMNFGPGDLGGSLILGQTLVNGATTHTPWMLNLADAINFAVEVIGRATNGNLTVTIQHKDVTQTDANATNDATTISANTVAVHRQRYIGDLLTARRQFPGVIGAQVWGFLPGSAGGNPRVGSPIPPI